MHLKYRNVNHAFEGIVRGIYSGKIATSTRPSRNGEVLQVEEPVIITYDQPTERVLFNRARDANPFFHVYEALWMLAGRDDVAPLAYYAAQMKNYSDDGRRLNGAYGYRWRKAKGPMRILHSNKTFIRDGVDQLKVIVDQLRAKPESRRVVLQMWTVEDDLLKIDTSKDVSCNVCAMFAIEDSGSSTAPRYLNMTVINRSNDLCLAGETKFRSPEGDTSIKELARKFQSESGFKFPIYAVDTVTGGQQLCWMSNAWKTGSKPVYRVGFDDGSFIRLTGDHVLFKKTKMFESERCVGLKIEEKQVCELSMGDRVLADIAEPAKSRGGSHIKITSIVKDGVCTVYDFTVPGRHNAVLNNGVVAHNCWGALGANVVHFSFLQEYLAAHLNVKVGVYNQISNNLHVYTASESGWHPEKWLEEYDRDVHDDEPVEYPLGSWNLVPLCGDVSLFDASVNEFVELNKNGEAVTAKIKWSEPFLQTVAQPMCLAFHTHKQRDYNAALSWCESISADDWRIASTVWITKRKALWNKRVEVPTDE